MDNGKGLREPDYESLFDLIRKVSPISALGVPGIAIGLFLIFFSPNLPAPGGIIVTWIGAAFLVLGAFAYAGGIVLAMRSAYLSEQRQDSEEKADEPTTLPAFDPKE